MVDAVDMNNKKVCICGSWVDTRHAIMMAELDPETQIGQAILLKKRSGPRLMENINGKLQAE